MPRYLRPYAVSTPATEHDVATIAGVLDEPAHALLPLAAGVDGDRVLAAARPDEPLDPALGRVVLGVATTGSTGTPKVVLHTTRSLRASIEATAQHLGGHGQWLLCMAVNHIAGIQVVLRAAAAGAAPVLSSVGGPTFVEDFAASAGRLTGDRRYTSMVPTQLRRLLEDARATDALRGFDAILLGGAAADAALLAQARSSGIAVVTTYGMSETSGGCVYDGVPLPGVQVDLVDGVVRLAGDVVAAGYRDRVEPYPFQAGAFTTTDLGEVHDGVLRILGRADDIINTGGKKVSPAVVEQALRGLAGVDDVIVVGVPDAEWGSRVVAVQVGTLTVEQIRTALRASVASHELPTAVVGVDQLPHAGIGKPDRRAATELAIERLRAPEQHYD